MKSLFFILTLSLLSGTTMAKSRSGSNIGGGNNGAEFVANWCKNQSSLLRAYRDRSKLKIENTGNYREANKILSRGIEEALGSIVGNNDPYLAKNLNRGLKIVENLNATSSSINDRSAMIANNIITEYYTFLIETVSHNLDIGAVLPHQSVETDRRESSLQTYEKAFVKYAVAQVEIITKNLINETIINQRKIATPVGDVKTLLKVSSIITEGVKEDLIS